MGVYTFIDNINNSELFRNIIIIIVVILFFINKHIGLNIILALGIATIIIFYLAEKKEIIKNTEDEQYKTKVETIKPHAEKLQDTPELIDFLFTIQDFYVFNPLAYEEMIDNLLSFKKLETNIYGEPHFANQYFQILESKAKNALNALQSIIFTLPSDKIYTDKFNRAHKRLETILNNHINQAYDQCTFYFYKNGPSVLTKQINIGPAEYNQYSDKEYTYQFY